MPFLRKAPGKNQGKVRRIAKIAGAVAGIWLGAYVLSDSGALKHPQRQNSPQAVPKGITLVKDSALARPDYLAKSDSSVLRREMDSIARKKFPGLIVDENLVGMLAKPETRKINGIADRWAKKRGLDGSYVWATIRKESFWDTQYFLNGKDAGLMQLSPITRKELRIRGLKIDPFNHEQALQGATFLMKLYREELSHLDYYHGSRRMKFRNLPKNLQYAVLAESYNKGITITKKRLASYLSQKKDASGIMTEYSRQVLRFMREKKAYDFVISQMVRRE
ncbi:MAG: transglycosylase SLT domain-containing protein [archaeon]